MPTQIGLSNLHYAILDKDDSATAKILYKAPIRIPGAINVSINPNPSTETLFADDGPMESATTLGEIEVEINVADLPISVQATLLGHTIGTDGVLVRKASDTPPFIALGFQSLTSDGSYRYVWLAKGRFSVPELSHQTKEDSIEFQTPTITASFVKREVDDVWISQGDENDAEFVTAPKWFLEVHGQNAWLNTTTSAWSSVYEVSVSGSTIKGVPSTATVSDVLSNVELIDPAATEAVTDSAGTAKTTTSTIVTGDKYKVTAADGTTVKTYEITVS